MVNAPETRANVNPTVSQKPPRCGHLKPSEATGTPYFRTLNHKAVPSRNSSRKILAPNAIVSAVGSSSISSLPAIMPATIVGGTEATMVPR